LVDGAIGESRKARRRAVGGYQRGVFVVLVLNEQWEYFANVFSLSIPPHTVFIDQDGLISATPDQGCYLIPQCTIVPRHAPVHCLGGCHHQFAEIAKWRVM